VCMGVKLNHRHGKDPSPTVGVQNKLRVKLILVA
jgi:hypothetical protein